MHLKKEEERYVCSPCTPPDVFVALSSMYVCMYVYVYFVLQGPTFGTPSGPGGGGLVEEFSVPAPKCGVIIGRGKFYVCVAYSSSLVGDYVVFVLL